MVSATESCSFICAILAGGRSRRLGYDKALLSLADKSLIEHVAERCSQQSMPPLKTIVCTQEDNDRAIRALGYTTVLDQHSLGPLSGLAVSLDYVIANHSHVSYLATVSCDGPFIPLDLFERLADAAMQRKTNINNKLRATFARDAQSAHYTHAFWPINELELQATLQRCLRNSTNERSLRHLLSLCEAESIAFDDETSFFNINTRDDLASAIKLLGASE